MHHVSPPYLWLKLTCFRLTIGSHCQKMAIPDSATLTLPLNPQYYQGFYEEQEGVAHAQIFVHPHSPAGRPVIPATVQLPGVHYGCTKFLGGCSAGACLVYQTTYMLTIHIYCILHHQWLRSPRTSNSYNFSTVSNGTPVAVGTPNLLSPAGSGLRTV